MNTVDSMGTTRSAQLVASKPDFSQALLDLWRQMLGQPDLSVDDDFFESGGDSILATEMIIAAERITGMTIPAASVFESGTIRRLAARFVAKADAKPEVAVRIGGDGGRLFHYFHGDFVCGGLSVSTIAGALSPEYSILAIAPHGPDGRELPSSIEGMAAERLSVVRSAQARGPYLLGGHCNGALVAFEIARMLVAAGEKVDLVVMIDPVVVAVRPTVRALLDIADRIPLASPISDVERGERRRRLFQRVVDAELWMESLWIGRRGRYRVLRTVRRIGGEVRRRLRERSVRGYRQAAVVSSNPQPQSPRQKPRSDSAALKRAYERVFSVYAPRPLDVPVLYLSLKYNGRPWRRIAPRVRLISLPGSHTHLQKASKTLADALSRWTGAPSRERNAEDDAVTG